MGKNNEKQNDKVRNPGRNSKAKGSFKKDSFKRGGKGEPGVSYSKDRAVGGYSHNDPSWYEPYSGSSRDVAQLSFGNPLGVTHRVTNKAESEAFPGMMVMPFTPIPGISVEGDRESPISTAAQAFYTTVRYAQGVAGNYDPVDLMCYPLMGDSIYTFWAFARRIIGTVNMYSSSNRYLARGLVGAMGVDFDDIRANLYDFNGWLNDLAYQMGSLCMPADFSSYKRHVRMCENLYTDGESAKAQLYLYVPAYLWYYDEFADEKYGALKPIEIYGETKGTTRLTFEQLRAIGDQIINSIRHSSTMMNMAGDIKRAYGDGALMKVPYTELGYMAPIIYDPDQCMEIQNTIVVGRFGAGRDHPNLIKAMRGTNTLVYDPSFINPLTREGMTSFAGPDEWYLNLRVDEPTPEQVMRATRLAVTFDPGVITSEDTDDPYTYTTLATAGSEVVHSVQMFYFQDSNVKNELSSIDIESWALIADDNSAVIHEQAIRTMIMMEKFDFHPIFYVYNSSTPGTATFEMFGITGDVQNVTWYGSEFLAKLNRYALLGEFKSPQMGTFFKR
nr:putative capsid [Marmot picobirnavirus]